MSLDEVFDNAQAKIELVSTATEMRSPSELTAKALLTKFDTTWWIRWGSTSVTSFVFAMTSTLTPLAARGWLTHR